MKREITILARVTDMVTDTNTLELRFPDDPDGVPFLFIPLRASDHNCREFMKELSLAVLRNTEKPSGRKST